MVKLEKIDLEQTLDKKEYKKKLKKLQYEMLNAQQFLFREKIGLVFAFEGMDAAGKGGAIKRLTEKIDPRGYVVHPISAPQPHELRYNYLHRFWRKLPQYGQIAIFDRSWYGRVLVERIEGFATKEEWKRAFDEINNFEKLLTDDHYILVKFWIHVDKEEQLQRFIDRAKDPYKAWKLTDEDWRNREKFDLYEEAAEDMFEKTNTEYAPWFSIAGNDKLSARIQVLENTLAHIKKELKRRGLKLTNVVEEAVVDIDSSSKPEELEDLVNGDEASQEEKKQKKNKKKNN